MGTASQRKQRGAGKKGRGAGDGNGENGKGYCSKRLPSQKYPPKARTESSAGAGEELAVLGSFRRISTRIRVKNRFCNCLHGHTGTCLNITAISICHQSGCLIKSGTETTRNVVFPPTQHGQPSAPHHKTKAAPGEVSKVEEGWKHFAFPPIFSYVMLLLLLPQLPDSFGNGLHWRDVGC